MKDWTKHKILTIDSWVHHTIYMLGEETNKKRSRYVPFHYSIILVQFNMYNHFPASWWGQARTKSNGVVKMSDEGRKDFEQVNVSWENYRKLCFSRTLIFQKTTWVEIVWLKELKRSSWEVKCRWPFQSAKLKTHFLVYCISLRVIWSS